MATRPTPTSDPRHKPSGERVTRDPEGTRRRILQAALHEFSEKGISGARVDAIAARAETNKRMLYHYFGSKEGLYRAVLQEGLASQPAGSAEQESRLARLNRRFATNPEWVRLLMWEALEQGTAPVVENESIRREGLARYIETIEADQAAGLLSPDLDAAQVALTEIGIAIMPFAFPQLARLATGDAPTSRRFQSARRTHLARLSGRVLASQRPR
jgi:TetR/AcrR family transcriptional regulator